jgi:hypothetical protein
MAGIDLGLGPEGIPDGDLLQAADPRIEFELDHRVDLRRSRLAGFGRGLGPEGLIFLDQIFQGRGKELFLAAEMKVHDAR